MEDLANCKSVSLRSWLGQYVVAEENGAANANRNDNRSRFTDWEVVSKPGTIWIVQKNDGCSKSRSTLDTLPNKIQSRPIKMRTPILYLANR